MSEWPTIALNQFPALHRTEEQGQKFPRTLPATGHGHRRFAQTIQRLSNPILTTFAPASMSPSILADLNFSNTAFINIGAGIVVVALALCGMSFHQARKPTQQQTRCKYERSFRQTSTSRLRVDYFGSSQLYH
jgi:hypothetical protein